MNDLKRYGQCGTEISDLFPHIGSIADDICVIRSMIWGGEFGRTPMGQGTGRDHHI
jgi:hypothetical protein